MRRMLRVLKSGVARLRKAELDSHLKAARADAIRRNESLHQRVTSCHFDTASSTFLRRPRISINSTILQDGHSNHEYRCCPTTTHKPGVETPAPTPTWRGA
jgi:hypothetical protein